MPTTPSTLAARIDALAMREPGACNAVMVVAQGGTPRGPAIRRAQALGLVDFRKGKGWTLYPQGREVAGHLLA